MRFSCCDMDDAVLCQHRLAYIRNVQQGPWWYMWRLMSSSLWTAGVATWCKLSYSARTAEVDCLGTDNDDFWGEGR